MGIHVGDIFWRPCTDEHYQQALERFNSLRHPVIYTPGDNEWTDCWERQSGGFKPTERLDRIRQIFFANHTRSLGQTVIEVEERLRKKREIAHTTVLTTMDRLYRKGSPDTLR